MKGRTQGIRIRVKIIRVRYTAPFPKEMEGGKGEKIRKQIKSLIRIPVTVERLKTGDPDPAKIKRIPNTVFPQGNGGKRGENIRKNKSLIQIFITLKAEDMIRIRVMVIRIRYTALYPRGMEEKGLQREEKNLKKQELVPDPGQN